MAMRITTMAIHVPMFMDCTNKGSFLSFFLFFFCFHTVDVVEEVMRFPAEAIQSNLC